ncbi:hypothetical protein VTK56DRAFT_6973 [Thermocarpiscus australiensis]
MKYSPAVWNGSLRAHDIRFILRFYLDYLYSIFLILRFNARQGQSQESLELLLASAKDVLSTVLVFNEQRELMREVRSDFSAVFLPYGLPCADVLDVELMYRPSSFSLGSSPNANPGPVRGPGPGPGPGGRPRPVRAQVIRDLTVYVSCLRWMPGRGGNSAEFSRDVQARLTQIMDQIIDAPLGGSAAGGNNNNNTGNNSNGTNGGGGALADDDQVGGGSCLLRGRESLDPSATNLNHLFFDWDTSMYSNSQLDLFSQSLM